MLEVARAIEVISTARAHIFVPQMVQVPGRPRHPHHTLPVIAALAHCSVTAVAVMLEQLFPLGSVERTHAASIMARGLVVVILQSFGRAEWALTRAAEVVVARHAGRRLKMSKRSVADTL